MGSLSLLQLVLGGTCVTLVGIFYPVVMLSLFLFFNLLFPKLPLIQIQNYLVPIRIDDVFLACALLSLVLRHHIYREKYPWNPLRRWMVAFSIVTGLSFLLGLFILGSVPVPKVGFLFWLRAPEYFSACYLCLLGVTNWKQHRQIVAVLMVFVPVIGVYGILQEFSLVPIFDAMHLTDEIVIIRFFSGFGEERLFSTFAGPYELAAFYLMAIPILTALLASAVTRVTKVLLAGTLTLSLFCFYLTFARAPLVALVMVLSVCFWFLGKRRLGMVLALFSFLPALLFSGFVSRLAYAADDPLSAYALGGRMETSWANALSAAFRSPLLGTGPASLGGAEMGVDGLYLMLLGMWGGTGLVCFLILISKAMRYQIGCIRISRNKTQRALAIGLFAGTIGLLVNGVTLDSFFNSKVAFSYWFLMGLLFAGVNLDQKGPLPLRPSEGSAPYSSDGNPVNPYAHEAEGIRNSV